MDQVKPNAVLHLQHSRGKLFFRLLILQIFGLAVTAITIRLFNASYSDGQLAIIVIGLLSGVAIYLPFTALAVAKLRNPEYLTVFEDGSYSWKPGFTELKAVLGAGVRWKLHEDRIEFVTGRQDAPVKTLPLVPGLVKLIG